MKQTETSLDESDGIHDNSETMGKHLAIELLLNPNSYVTGLLFDRIYTFLSDRKARRNGALLAAENRELLRKVNFLKKKEIWSNADFEKYLRQKHPAVKAAYAEFASNLHKGKYHDRFWLEYVRLLYNYRDEYGKYLEAKVNRP